MSDVWRVGVEEQDDGVYEVWVDSTGTHYLVPVEEYERLRNAVQEVCDWVREMVRREIELKKLLLLGDVQTLEEDKGGSI